MNYSISLSPEDDAFVRRIMQARRWKRSQVIREALTKLRSDPVLFLADVTTTSSLNDAAESMTREGGED